MSDEQSWQVAHGKLRGLPIFYRFRSDLDQSISPATHQERFYITWNFDAASDEGLPDEATNETIADFEDAVMDAFEQDDLCRIYSICTYNGAREWTAYTSSSQELLRVFNEAVAGRGSMPIQLRVENDPDWSDYRGLLKRLGVG